MINYYGIAICSNVNNLQGMTKAVHHSIFHIDSSKIQCWHDHCLPGKDSWCLYQVDTEEGANKYKSGAGLPLDVMKHVKPIMQENYLGKVQF